MGTFFSGLRRGESVKAGKGAGEALRAVVAVFQRSLQHFGAGCQLAARQRQAAVTDIFRRRIAAENAENAPEIKGREVRRAGSRLGQLLLSEMRFDIIECAL